MIVLFKSRTIYIVLIVVAICFFVLNGEYIAYAAVVAILSLPVFLYGITLLTSFKIMASFGECGYIVQKLDEAMVEIKLESTAFFPVNTAKLHIECRSLFSNEKIKEVIVLSINSKETTAIKTALRSKYCGDTEITIKKLVLYDFFSVTRHSKRINKTFKVTVLPSVYDVLKKAEPPLSLDEESYSYSTHKSGDDSSQVFDYHEYREGDRMKDIHWKLSTKLDKLMVKEGSLPNSASVLIAFEFNMADKKKLNMAVVDGALDALTSISTWFLSSDIAQSIEWYTQKEEYSINMKLESSDELYLTLQNIYQTKPYIGNPLLSEIALRTAKFTTQMLYITSKLEQSMLDSLVGLGEKTKLIVCVVHDKESVINELLARELEQQGIVLIDLDVESINESLHNIAV